jgi:hypothetical protein
MAKVDVFVTEIVSLIKTAHLVKGLAPNQHESPGH